MTVLQINPESSPLVHAAAAVVLYLHISAGSVGIVSGAAAFMVPKGTALHRLIGNIFVVSMLLMSGIGAVVAPFLPTPERASVIAGALTFYLVLSAWATVKRKPGQCGRADYAALGASLGITAASAFYFGLASQSPGGKLDGQPSAAFVMFIIIGSLAAVGDARLIWQRGVTGATRLARHLWRMTMALFIAANSLFLGQQQVFPKALRGSVWLMIPALVILGLLVYWLCHVGWGAYWHQRRQVAVSNSR